VDLVGGTAYDCDRATQLLTEVGQRSSSRDNATRDRSMTAGVHRLDAAVFTQRGHRVIQAHHADRSAGAHAVKLGTEGGRDGPNAWLNLETGTSKLFAEIARTLVLLVAELRVSVHEAHHLAHERHARVDRGEHTTRCDHVVKTTLVASRESKAR
jgi:hypothetical protein